MAAQPFPLTKVNSRSRAPSLTSSTEFDSQNVFGPNLTPLPTPLEAAFLQRPPPMSLNLVNKDYIANLSGFRICLSSDMSSFIANQIRWLQSGNPGWTHAWILTGKGQCVSQNWILEQEPLSNYLNGTTRIEMWRCGIWNDDDIQAMFNFINQKLALPRSQRKYDWWAYAGQLLRRPRIQNPRAYFCSEFARDVMVAGGVDKYLERTPLALLRNPHPNPGQIHDTLIQSAVWCSEVYDPTL